MLSVQIGQEAMNVFKVQEYSLTLNEMKKEDFMNEEVVVYVDSDLEDLIPGFLENRYKDVEVIKKLLMEEDVSEIQRLGHSMKGAGGGYGFDEISEIGKRIEEAAKIGDVGKLERLNNTLAGYLSSVKVVYQDEE